MPTWVYRLLLRAYPRPFRARYGPELVEGLEHLRLAAEARGTGARFAFWVRTALDVVQSGLRERASLRGYRMGSGGVRLPAGGPLAWIRDLAVDLRYTVRTLRASPGYVAGVTGTLALGIGATTALFSVAWAVFGRPLPFTDGNELVRVASVRPDWSEGMAGTREITLSVPELEDLQRVEAFEDVAEYHRMTFTLIGPGGPELVTSAVVSSNYFDFLGMAPMLGRLFDPVEDSLGARPVLVLSHDFWRDVFEGDEEVVGSTVRMNGEEHEIVGVLPPIPQFPQVNDVYLPISMCPTRSDPGFMADRDGRLLTAYARLDDGATLGDGEAELARAAERMHREHEGYAAMLGGHDLVMTPLREELVARARPVMWPLIGVSALLLLVACANAAGLALTRASQRMESLAVRSAMGAGRGRLARQLLTESSVLGLVGGMAGLALALVGSDLLATFAANFTTRAQEIRVDRTVLAFAGATSLLTGIVFGVAPVALSARVARGLGRAGGASTGRYARRLQQALVGVQVAVAFSVVAGAGLLLRSFWEANSLAIGIDTEHVVSAEFAGGWDRYPGVMEMRDMLADVRTELEADPTFLATARIPWTPLASPHVHRDGYFLRGDDGEWHAAVGDGRGVDPSYFETLGIEVVAGRGLTAADTAGTPHVVVVNETFWRHHMEGVASLGTLARACEPEAPCGPDARIVGVVEDVRINGAEFEVAPEVFIPLEQTDWFVSVLVARVTGPPDEALLKMVAAVHARDPDLAVRNAGSLEEFRRETVAPRRFMAGLLLAFALVTGGLALAGVFGVTALAVAARTREIGIRRALGATESQASALVLREGLGVVALGGVAGLALTLGTARLLEGLLYGVRPTDPLVLAAGAVVFLAAAALACIAPARRIARIRVPETLSAP